MSDHLTTRELADLFADHGIEIVPQDSLGVIEAEETGLSFVENAILKARNAARQTGRRSDQRIAPSSFSVAQLRQTDVIGRLATYW